MSLAIERLSEGRWAPPWIRSQHIERYRWACQWTIGRTVIDAACGTGYGAKMLADGGADRVVGFDLSAETVRDATLRHGSERVAFEVADATRLPVADHASEVYVSLETIEHVEDDGAFVREAARVVKAGGRFICSTPNRAITNPGISIKGKPYNPYHVREYTGLELENLLRPWFREVVLFGQSFYTASYARRLRAAAGIFPMLAVRLHQMRKCVGIPWERPQRHIPNLIAPTAEPEVLIAVCTA